MTKSLQVLMAQINPLVGAIGANTQKIIAIIKTHQEHFDLIVFPELALTAYPPEDLLLRDDLYQQVEEALIQIQQSITQCSVIVGHPSLEAGQRYNSASILSKGATPIRYHKQSLPNYGVFDEQRYFSNGKPTACTFEMNGYRIGLCICEDLWQPGPVERIIAAKAEILVCINASPFERDKFFQREELLKRHSKNNLAIIYVNQIGGQDEIVFDGQSVAVDCSGKLCARASAFSESLHTVRFQDKLVTSEIAPPLPIESLIYKALQCGLHDYVLKNKFPGVIVGLSGGIDSALTLALATDALGADKVQAVLMPSRYTAEMSNEDAITQANALGVGFISLPIEPTYHALIETLAPAFNGRKEDSTEENLQARIRGILLMALSNKTGKMVLCTSNKSEAAVGYTTLYGDMVGGLAPLKDLFKTEVYALANYRNSIGPVIPKRVITRAPSAELAPNQKDQDTLAPYPVLDGILQLFIEQNKSADEIIKAGYSGTEVARVIQLIVRNEYKRRQSPPAIKISNRNFGRDWRYPMTAGFEHLLAK